MRLQSLHNWYNPSQEGEVSLNSTSGTLRAKTAESLEVDATQTSLSLIDLPPEVLFHIFSYLSLKDLSQVAAPVSSHLKKVSENSPLWKEMSFKLELVDESFANTNLNYKVMVVTAFDPAFIGSIFNRICISIPESIHFSTEKKDSLMKIHSLVRLCCLGDKMTLLNAVGDVITLSRDLSVDADKELIERTAREFIECHVAQGNRGAIQKKVYGLIFGEYGYKQDPVAARELNDTLVAKGDRGAIVRKMDGLSNGRNGYENDPAAARELNNALIARTDSEAIQRKLTWLSRNSKMPWENYIDCLKMALGVTDSLEILSESPEKAYIDCLGVFSQRIKQLGGEP